MKIKPHLFHVQPLNLLEGVVGFRLYKNYLGLGFTNIHNCAQNTKYSC